MKTSGLTRLFVIVSIFAIAMGFLESAVVIYLRKIYYPEGFNFPLTPIDQDIAITEFLREVATMVMLFTLGILAGKNMTSRFAWFLYSFAVWDIFYYVFLKVLINWPESLLTNDILFLIPVTWVGPVITPVLVSFTMITLASLILIYNSKGIKTTINKWEWGLFILGSLILVVAFTWDYSKYILSYYSFSDIWTLPDKGELYLTASKYIPVKFNWLLFVLGEVIIISGIGLYWHRLQKRGHPIQISQ